MKKYIPLLALLAISLIVHFAWFGYPNSTVFDEVHFGKFISAYFTHEYYFDIHPALGKLILAGWGWIWGFKPGFSFAEIGEVFPDHAYLALRFLPTLAGALLPLVIYGLARQLGMSRRAGLFAGALVALDNALLVQSRFILLDSFLLLFGFGALWCYFRWRNRGSPYLLIAAGALGGMAMSIKWTGATFLALIVIIEIIHLWRDRHTIARQRLIAIIGALIILPVVLYYGVFAIHFALLSKPGPGDAFMSQAFQQGQLNPLQKFIELNQQMYESNQHLTATHPYSSKWYTWPLMQRPIFYWVQDHARIYLLGNPLIWWSSTVALIVAMLTLILSGLRRTDPTLLIMIGAWLMNMLPFIGISRVMFLYHYLTGLIWAILILAYLLDKADGAQFINVTLYNRVFATTLKSKHIAIWFIICALLLFIFFAPLSYGLPLSDSAYHARVWLSSWQ